MLPPAIRRMRQHFFPALVLSLLLSLTLGCGSGSAHTEPAQMVFPAATVPLTKLSSDPYTNCRQRSRSSRIISSAVGNGPEPDGDAERILLSSSNALRRLLSSAAVGMFCSSKLTTSAAMDFR